MAENGSVQVTGTTGDTAVATQESAPALHRYRDAFQKALPKAQLLNDSDLVTINIDVPSAVTTCVGKLPEIWALREQAKALPDFDMTVFDDLETYTLATGHAHSLYMGASAPAEAIVQLNERGMDLRNMLYSDAVALANRNLISGDRIGELKANVGYKNLAFDLMALTQILRLNWDNISTRTAILPAELDEAESIGDQLVNAVGARQQQPAAVAQVALQRQQQFTLFVKAYDQARRAVSYLRWNKGDTDRIAPSLYAGRTSSRKKPDVAQPATPTAVPDAGGATGPTTPTTGATAPAMSAAAPAATPSTSAGLPGANPFAGVS